MIADSQAHRRRGYNCKATKREKPEKQIEMSKTWEGKVGKITSLILGGIIKAKQSFLVWFLLCSRKRKVGPQ